MPTRGVFSGWWVALSFAVMAFLSSGIRFAVGPFPTPMVADLELDRASFSLVIAFGLLLFGALLLGPAMLSATIAERRSPVVQPATGSRRRSARALVAGFPADSEKVDTIVG
jgi:hypothetical protein